MLVAQKHRAVNGMHQGDGGRAMLTQKPLTGIRRNFPSLQYPANTEQPVPLDAGPYVRAVGEVVAARISRRKFVFLHALLPSVAAPPNETRARKRVAHPQGAPVAHEHAHLPPGGRSPDIEFLREVKPLVPS